MTIKEIQDLLKFVSKSELSEVRIKDADFELTIRNKNYAKGTGSPGIVTAHPVNLAPPSVPAIEPVAVQDTPAAQSGGSAATGDSDSVAGLLEVKSPIVGTFYRSASPDKPPYVSIGDTIGQGSVVCIVEAMKLFNEIESEVAGKIVKVMIEDASPVEYDQVLFLVDPKG